MDQRTKKSNDHAYDIYIQEMTEADYMYEEKKAEDDLPALKTALTDW